jgi:hypothetical protein
LISARSTQSVYWRSIAFPVEHGGWGLLAEPVLLGLVLAPSRAGVALAAGVLFAFLARHPLRLVLLDRRKAARYPRTVVAERWLGCYLGMAVASLLLALGLTAAFWPALAVALPPGVVALLFDARGRSREAAAEIAGACALSTSSSAIALAGGAAAGLAFGASALLAMRAVATILYVRARIRQDRGLEAGSRQALLGHVLALVGAVAVYVLGWGPLAALPAFAILLVRAAWGLSKRRRVLRPQALGYQEMGFGLLTLVLLAVGYRLPAGRLPWL